MTPLSPSGVILQWQNVSLAGTNRTRWHCHLQTQFLFWIMLLFTWCLSKKPFLICKECVGSLYSLAAVPFSKRPELLHGRWRSNTCKFKIRPETSRVDNWLSTAWVSEPLPLISATCKCQPQHPFHVTWSLCVPRAGAPRKSRCFEGIFPTFLFLFFISHPFFFSPQVPLNQCGQFVQNLMLHLW